MKKKNQYSREVYFPSKKFIFKINSFEEEEFYKSGYIDKWVEQERKLKFDHSQFETAEIQKSCGFKCSTIFADPAQWRHVEVSRGGKKPSLEETEKRLDPKAMHRYWYGWPKKY